MDTIKIPKEKEIKSFQDMIDLIGDKKCASIKMSLKQLKQFENLLGRSGQKPIIYSYRGIPIKVC